MLIVKSIENKTMDSTQELYLFLFSFLAECNPVECNSIEVILASFTSSTVTVHSSTNLSANLFFHLQFS